MNDKIIVRIVGIFVACGIIGIFITIVAYYRFGHIQLNEDINHDKIGAFGSFIGGFIGIIFSIATTLLVWLTYKSQKKELGETRNILINQQFESMFFNTLTILNNVIQNTKGKVYRKGDNIYSGQEFYSTIMEMVKNSDSITLRDINKALNDQGVNTDDTNIRIFQNVYKNNQSQLSHFFKLFSNLLDQIDNNINLSDLEKSKYVNLLEAQLSTDILGLVFYYAICGYCLNSDDGSKLHSLLDKHLFLRNIDVNGSLIDPRDSYKYYPNTFPN